MHFSFHFSSASAPASAPVSAQCVKMDGLLSTMQPPQGFICEPADECRGFSCAGEVGLLGILVRFLIHD